MESHARFKDSLSLPFPLLADPGGVVSKAYDALMFYGGEPYSQRKLVLIGRDGMVVWRDERYEVGSADDWQAVLAALSRVAP